MSKKKIYKFTADCGRMGSLSSVFVSEPKYVKALIGSNVYFGEVLGKHSEVSVDITAEHIVELPAVPEVVEFFETHLGGSVGHNPLHYDEDA